MRLGPFLASAAVLSAFGFVGFRIVDLEQRVALLTAHDDRGEKDSSASRPPVAASGGSVLSRDIDARLRSIEQRIAALENLKQALALPASALGEDRLKQEQAILSVVERENSRIRDVQLEWHKARWLETRKQQLAAFAYSQKLEPAQTTQLYDAIERELNQLAEVMKRPNFAEDPDQAATDWLNILAATDQRAQETLKPEQYQTWAQGRLFEKKVLWPWLPDSPQPSPQE